MDFGQTLLVIAAVPSTQPLRSACTRLIFCEDRNLSPPPPGDEVRCGEGPALCSSPSVSCCAERITCHRPSPTCAAPVVPALAAG